MKTKSTYESPEISILYVSPADIITSSFGDEGEWDVHSDLDPDGLN